MHIIFFLMCVMNLESMVNLNNKICDVKKEMNKMVADNELL